MLPDNLRGDLYRRTRGLSHKGYPLYRNDRYRAFFLSIPQPKSGIKEFRNAILHNRKDIAYAKLEQIKEVVGEDDPFLITARIALERMK